MKLKVLVENNTYIDMYYLGEPALSFYLEDGDQKILFDTGYSDAFMKNAVKMGIDLSAVDLIVLSHGHNDHSGGLVHLKQLLSGTKLLAHPDAFFYKEDDTGLQIGSPLSLADVDKDFALKLSRDPIKITDKLYYLGQIEESLPFERRYPIGKRIYGDLLKDDYLYDDSALAYRSEKGLFIITGCSHAGICNIIEQAKKVCDEDRIYGVIGGFHLFEDDERLQGTIAYFKENMIKELYPCHCVSLKAKIALARQLEIKEVGTGLELEVF